MGKATKVKNQAKKAGILTDEVVVKKSKVTPPVELDEELDLLEEIAEDEALEELELPEEEEELEEQPSQSTAAAEKPKKGNLIKSRGELDEYGFGSETHSSFLLSHLEQGTNTKAEIVELFCDHFRMDIDGKATTDKKEGKRDDARKKSSMSVFFSDVVKPFGTYHASRSLIIVEDEKTRRLSLEPRRVATVKKAIANGIVAKLKGFSMKKHPEKVAVILKNFGLPKE